MIQKWLVCCLSPASSMECNVLWFGFEGRISGEDCSEEESELGGDDGS